jgi:hypothetical protein
MRGHFTLSTANSKQTSLSTRNSKTNMALVPKNFTSETALTAWVKKNNVQREEYIIERQHDGTILV